MQTFPQPAETQEKFDPQDPLATAWQRLHWTSDQTFELRWQARLDKAYQDVAALWKRLSDPAENAAISPAGGALEPIAAIRHGAVQALIAHGDSIEQGDQVTVYYPRAEEAQAFMVGQLHVLPYGLDRHYPGAVGILTSRIDLNPIESETNSAKELFIDVPIPTFNPIDPEYVEIAAAETLDWDLVRAHGDWELQCLSYLLDQHARENGITQIRFHAEYFYDALSRQLPLDRTPQMVLATKLNWYPSDSNRFILKRRWEFESTNELPGDRKTEPLLVGGGRES